VLNASAGSATADYVVPTTPTFISTISSVANDPGQIIFTGSNYILAIPQSSTAGPHDSICIFGSTCSALASAQALSPYGMAIDGDGALWMADAGNTVNADSSTNKAYAGAQTVPLITAGTPGSYVGTGGTAINHAYFHGTGNGATAFTPYGIAIDNSGNVWMSNVGCVITAPATSCTPGSFVLTELIGAAAPTITPVSTAIVGNNNGPGTRP
jgi:streptogramin lyase